MALCSAIGLLRLALVVGGVSYMLYIPVPDGVHDRTAVQVSCQMSRIMKIMAYLAQISGLRTNAEMRRNILSLLVEDGKPPKMEGLQTEDYEFNGVFVRFYRPVAAVKPSPCVVYIHGGGWTTFNIESYDHVVADLAMETNYVFMQIEYRLSPEHPFPKPFEDCYAAVLHLLKNAANLGVDLNKIAISGDSAGGNLAAAVSLKLRNENVTPVLKFQWLIYPSVQSSDLLLPSFISNEKAVLHFLQPRDIAWHTCNHIGIEPTTTTIEAFIANRHTSQAFKDKFRNVLDYKQLPSKYHNVIQKQVTGEKEDTALALKIEHILVNPYFAPLLADDLSRLPATFIVTAEYDVLRDDGLLYAARLKKSGVDVTTYTSPHSIHGYMFWNAFGPMFSDANNTVNQFVEFAKKHFR